MQITKKRIKEIIAEEVQRLNELDPMGPRYSSGPTGTSMQPPKAPESDAGNALKMLAQLSLSELDMALDNLSGEERAKLKKLGRILSTVNTEDNFTEFDFSESPTEMGMREALTRKKRN